MKKITDVAFRSGDIGLSMSEGLFAKVIKATTSWITGKATVNHTFNFVGPDLIVEATNKIRLSSLSKYDSKKYKKIVVYRFPLTEDDRRRFRIGMLQKVNGAYGWTKLPLFGLDALSTKFLALFGRKKPVFFFTKTFGIFSITVCSQLSVYALHKFTSYELRNRDGKKVNWRIVNPDYFEDLAKLSHNGAHRIYSS